mgnify:CR=1 FL=1
MTEITLTLPYPPSINNYYGYVRGRVYIKKPGKVYRRAVWAYVKKEGFPMLHGPLELMQQIYPPDRKRRDIDNINKCLLDALQHADIMADDSQIKTMHQYMREPVKGGRVIVTISAQTPLITDEQQET